MVPIRAYAQKPSSCHPFIRLLTNGTFVVSIVDLKLIEIVFPSFTYVAYFYPLKFFSLLSFSSQTFLWVCRSLHEP